MEKIWFEINDPLVNFIFIKESWNKICVTVSA